MFSQAQGQIVDSQARLAECTSALSNLNLSKQQLMELSAYAAHLEDVVNTLVEFVVQAEGES